MTPEQQEQAKKMMEVVIPNNHEMWSLGMAMVLWGRIDNEFRRTVHALVDGDQAKWDEFNALKTMYERLHWAPKLGYEKFLTPFAREFTGICLKMQKVHDGFLKILDRSWVHETGYISFCKPEPLPKWMSEFPDPHWDWDAFEFAEFAFGVDTLRLRVERFNERFKQNPSGTEAGAREAIQRMFKANNPDGAKEPNYSKGSMHYYAKLMDDFGID